MTEHRGKFAAVLHAPIKIHRKLSTTSLKMARFITRTGKSRGEAVFWIVGASVAAFGAAIVVASKLGDLAGILTLQRWQSSTQLLELGMAITVIYLVGHVFVGLVCAVREEARWVRRGGDRP